VLRERVRAMVATTPASSTTVTSHSFPALNVPASFSIPTA